jgi:tRNA threonylcarbamoyladenosine biosynthesis protein TsaB
MATILNIETSGQICSVSLTEDGMILYQLEDTEGMNHAVKLAPFVDKCLVELKRKEKKLDAIAVSMGPGSYTGLRIGLSMAKGLATGLEVPLIGLSTLKILAVQAMFSSHPWQGDEVIVPMTDARRMEVYTAAYDFALNEVIAPKPLILNEDSYADLLRDHHVVFVGNGTDKARTVISSPNASWIEGMNPHARDMMALAEKALREKDFIDVAYSVPAYLKEYRTTVAKPRL